MQEHPINNLMEKAMENIKKMVEVNTIVGRGNRNQRRHRHHSRHQSELRFRSRRQRVYAEKSACG